MIRIMIAVVILACVAPFLLQGPDGNPLITLEDLIPDLPFASSAEEESVEPAPVILYKWQDEEGVWHFSNSREDAEIAGAEAFEVEGDVNLMPEVKAPPKRAAQPGVATQAAPAPVPSITGGLDELKSAAELQSTIDARKADLDEELNRAGGR